jgi:hypothetical protein
LKALVGLESRAVPPTLPRALARDVSFPYVDRGGYGFAQHLYREGGMAALDAAYRRLPQATYEVMYPNAYDIKWRPATVTMHGIAGLTGWTQLDDDVFGAFGYHLLIWQYLPKPIADRVVADYRGDRYIYLENGIQGLLVMRSRWTSHIAANRAKSTLFQALRHRFPNAPITNVNGTVIAGARMSVYLRAQGSLLVVVFAPDPSLARQAGTAPVT